MDILHQYKISFFTKILFGYPIKGINSVSPLLDMIVSDLDKIYDANDVISAIDDVLNEVRDEIVFSTQTLTTAEIRKEITTIYDDPNFDSNTPKFSLPTLDFKKIIEKWIAFLKIKN